MKKIILFLFIAVASAFVSCSDDDKNVSYPVPVSVADHITITSAGGDADFTLEYDGMRRISKVTKVVAQASESYEIELTYDTQNRIVRLDVNSTTDGIIEYEYNNNLLSNISINGSDTPVTYNTTTKMYTAGALNFSLSDNGDLKTDDEILFNFGTQKGATANLNTSYGLLNFLDPDFLPYLLTKKAVTSVTDQTNPSNPMVFSNTYTNDNMVETMTADGGVVTFHYIQIF